MASGGGTPALQPTSSHGRQDARSTVTARRSSAASNRRVLVLTTFGEDGFSGARSRAGRRVRAQDSSARMIAAVRAVAEGGAWFDPGVAPRLSALPEVVAAARDSARLRLTDREHEVLRLWSRRRERRCSDVARRGGPSRRTSETSSPARRSHRAAVVFAYDHGVVARQRRHGKPSTRGRDVSGRGVKPVHRSG